MIERALIIQKHWLDQIFDNGKVWEMRSFKTNITGRIGLIESGSGLIIGEATLKGCLSTPVPKINFFKRYHKVEDLSLLDKWKYAWVLEDAKRYKKPIHYNHPQGAVIWVKLHSFRK